MTKMNFVFNHAYSVLVSYEFEASGLKTRLVKIRNPWGKTDREKLIGEKFLKSYQNNTDIEKNIGKLDDGNLVLTYDEFLRYFSNVYICRYRDNYELLTEDIKDLGEYQHFKVFKLDLRNIKNTKDLFYITVAKPSNLMFIEDQAKRQKVANIYTSLFIGKYDSNRKIKYAYHSCNFDSNNTIELKNFEPAEYVILAHIDKHNLPEDEDPSFLGTLQIYSKETYLTITPDYKEDPGILFTELLQDYYKQFQYQYIDTKTNLHNWLAYSNYFYIHDTRYLMSIVENTMRNSELQLDIDIKPDERCKEYGKILSEKKDKYKITLGYGENFIYSSYRYRASITNSHIMKIKEAPTIDELKMLVKKANKYNYYINKEECFYYYYRHNNGVVYYFPNQKIYLLEVNIAFTDNENLIYEGAPTKEIVKCIPPNNEEYVFLSKKIERLDFTNKWRVSGFIID